MADISTWPNVGYRSISHRLSGTLVLKLIPPRYRPRWLLPVFAHQLFVSRPILVGFSEQPRDSCLSGYLAFGEPCFVFCRAVCFSSLRCEPFLLLFGFLAFCGYVLFRFCVIFLATSECCLISSMVDVFHKKGTWIKTSFQSHWYQLRKGMQ